MSGSRRAPLLEYINYPSKVVLGGKSEHSSDILSESRVAGNTRRPRG